MKNQREAVEASRVEGDEEDEAEEMTSEAEETAQAKARRPRGCECLVSCWMDCSSGLGMGWG